MALTERWTPRKNLACVYRFVHERILPATPEIFLHLSDELKESGTAGAAEAVDALLVDAFEHLLSAPTDELRVAHLRRYAGKKVLDFGCGNGFFALDLAIRGADVTCIELNSLKREYLAWAAARMGATSNIRFEPSDSYDGVVCFNVLDHLPNAPAVVADLAAMLRPRGSLFLYAHFSADGVHVSDPETISQTFVALTRNFERAPLEIQCGPCLEHWIRRPEKGTSGMVATERWSIQGLDVDQVRELFPRAHPEISVSTGDGGESFLHGERFYLLPTMVGEAVVRILALCDGAKSVGTLWNELGDPDISEADLMDVLCTLCEGRFVSFLPQAASRGQREEWCT